MKIYGDVASSKFKTHVREPGIICGHNDVLMGNRLTFRNITFSFFGNRDESITVQPKLYLHISNTGWSSFTGILREYFLPWRWKAAYLDQENGTQPQRILVCTSVCEGELSDHLRLLLGKSLFVTNLINANRYYEIFNQEYLIIPRQEYCINTISHPLGEWLGLHTLFGSNNLCHIHRVRGVFSSLKYHFLKHFSREWEEVAIRAGQISENVLIKRNDRVIIAGSGLLDPLHN